MSAAGGARARAKAASVAVALLLAVCLPLAGCAELAGRKLAEPTLPDWGPANVPEGPPAQVHGGTGSASDRLAATVATQVERHWRQEFATTFRRPWPNIHGYYAIDPRDQAHPVPCVRNLADLTDQAAYCPRLDTITWDRVGLIPRLRSQYGDSAVVVALAHEIGHAVQNRLGIDSVSPLREPDRYPAILVEVMADCFAGVAVRAGVDGRLAPITISTKDLDRALSALLSFRDPVGMTAGPGAHGAAFDRASAFIDGYRNGARGCAQMTADNQIFAQRGFASLADAARGGDLPLDELLDSLTPDARAWFSQLVSDRGRPWQAPRLVRSGGCATPGSGRQGPVRFCPSNGTLVAATGDLASVHRRGGDYASGTLVASRYALAAWGALGHPVHGAEAGRAAVCLTGAYTRALFDRQVGFTLSPGDLDEAVDELVSQDLAARDAAGNVASGDFGFARIEQFRAGALGGPSQCGI